MRLLPDQTDLAWCYEILQWWDFLHVLTQATVILLLDLTIGPAAMSSEEAAVLAQSASDVLNGAKKGISWLHCLGSTSEAARRSFRFCNACIRRMAATNDLDLSGIPSPDTSSSTSLDSQEGKETASQQEMEDAPVVEQSKPVESSRSSQGERSDDLLFQDPQDEQPPMGSLQSPFALFDTDIDMSDNISLPANAEVEDMLLSMMRSNT
ncbi:uncharacterized protein PFLUO_LOCUS1210 [Penicillium psychrofluorescens]|uniref:uncharacterized protein n=1 Tax=Penicillium psychrofluorescens TaxID=3158075 RepID=UPI003CCCD514